MSIPAHISPEGKALYQSVLSRIGGDWAPLSRVAAKPEDHADDIHMADALAEWGLAERRVVTRTRANGTVISGHSEYRTA